MFVLKLLAGAAFTKKSCIKISLFQLGSELADMLCTMWISAYRKWFLCTSEHYQVHLRALSVLYIVVRQRHQVALKCG